MKVSEWIARHPGRPVTVAPDATLEEMVDCLLDQPGVREIYVEEGGRLVGRLSHRRLVQLLLAEHQPVHTRRQLMERVAGGAARDLMDVHFPFVPPEEGLGNVLHRQMARDIEDMPVIAAEGTLVGRVNLREVIRAYRNDSGEEGRTW
jgi:CBS domain-containing protein